MGTLMAGLGRLLGTGQLWAKAEHGTWRVFYQRGEATTPSLKSLSILSEARPPRGVSKPSPPRPCWLGKCVPLDTRGEGAEAALLHSPPSGPLPLPSVSAPRQLEHLQLAEGPPQPPSVWSELPRWGAIQRPSVPYPCPPLSHSQSAPARPLPLPPLSRGAPGEPGEQTQQIAESESAEPAPSARPAAGLRPLPKPPPPGSAKPAI